jgi:hypothetical protein
MARLALKFFALANCPMLSTKSSASRILILLAKIHSPLFVKVKVKTTVNERGNIL